jgi:hypothetical protein
MRLTFLWAVMFVPSIPARQETMLNAAKHCRRNRRRVSALNCIPLTSHISPLDLPVTVH